MKRALIIFLALFMVQLVVRYTMESLGIGEKIYGMIAAAFASGLTIFIAQKIGLFPLKRS